MNGAIQMLVPTILERHDEVMFEPGAYGGPLGGLIDRMLGMGVREKGQLYKVMLLSPPDDPQTLKLEREIVNDVTAESGRTAAFTQNQRYVAEEKLRKARTTSALA